MLIVQNANPEREQLVLFTQGLNEVFAVFSDAPEVRSALKAFKERTPEVGNERLLELFKALCKNLRIETKPLNDSFFMQPFHIDRGVLRKDSG